MSSYVPIRTVPRASNLRLFALRQFATANFDRVASFALDRITAFDLFYDHLLATDLQITIELQVNGKSSNRGHSDSRLVKIADFCSSRSA